MQKSVPHEEGLSGKRVRIDLPDPGSVQGQSRVDNEKVSNNVIMIQSLAHRSCSSLKVKSEINGFPVEAVVDTAADVTIISESICCQLQIPQVNSKQVRMHAAGENQSFVAQMVGPVNLKIGSFSISTELFVAPICDNMLLGMDMLRILGAKIDIQNQQMECGHETLPLSQSSRTRDRGKKKVRNPIPPNKPVVVRLKKGLIIPAESEVVLPIRTTAVKGPTYILEPQPGLKVLAARALYQGTSEPHISLVNCKPTDIQLKKGTVIGELLLIRKEDILRSENEESLQDPWVRRVQTTT